MKRPLPCQSDLAGAAITQYKRVDRKSLCKTAQSTSKSHNHVLWTLGVSPTQDMKEYDRERRCNPVTPDEEIYDDTITITSNSTIYQLVTKLCAGPVRERRPYGASDSSPTGHLWKIHFIPTGIKMDYRTITGDDLMMRDMLREECFSDDEITDRQQTELCVGLSQGYAEQVFDEMSGNKYVRRIDPDMKISDLAALEVGGSVYFKCDLGSTTDVFLRVVNKRPFARENLSQKLSAEHQADVNQQDITKVPAYNLPKEQQIDAHYPCYAKAFLSQSLAGITLGLCSRVKSEHDCNFSSMEHLTSGHDVLYCPLPFFDMDVFLTLVEEGFSTDPTEDRSLRFDDFARYALPPTTKGKEIADTLREQEAERDTFWGRRFPKRVYLHRDTVTANTDSFCFAKVFPKTHAQLTSGRFRWIKYQKGLLKVVVGRGVGTDHRIARTSQVLRQWKERFSSLHQLLCAVEASWCVPGQPSVDLGSTFLPLHDSNLEPSNPSPPVPPVLSQKKDATSISEPHKVSRVTALAVVGESGPSPTVYSGHEDGTMRRWDLSEGTAKNSPVWTTKAFRTWPKECRSDYESLRSGVRSIAVRENRDQHLVYTWSHQGVGDVWDKQYSTPQEILVFKGEDGHRHHSIPCDVIDERGYYPAISAVVFTPLMTDGRWVDSILVGLQATATTYEYDSNFSNYDFEEAQELAEGNIVPFSYTHTVWRPGQEEYPTVRGETWRGHHGFIRAMAVTDRDNLIASLSENGGHGIADELIMWSTEDPGVPLSKLVLYTDRRRECYSVIHGGVTGMMFHDDVILVSCGYGDILVPVRVEDNSLIVCGSANLKQRHYTHDSLHGHMASGGTEVCAIVNEGSSDVWLYSSVTLAQSIYLDNNTRHITEDEEEYSDQTAALKARAAALGVVKLDCNAGGPPPPKKSKHSPHLSGEGAEVVALKGRYLIAGYGNGAIVAAPLLPHESPFGGRGVRGYGLTSSCSSEKEGCCEGGPLLHLGENARQ